MNQNSFCADQTLIEALRERSREVRAAKAESCSARETLPLASILWNTERLRW